MNLKNNTIDNQEQSSENQEEELLKYKISHLVSANRLKVYVRIDLIDKEAEISCEDIMNYINQQGIIYGIKENQIKKCCEKKEYAKEITVAIGIEPIDGENAELKYDFDTSEEKKFVEKEDGTVDYQNLNNIINVKKDDVLCHIIPQKKGTDGIDVYGNTIVYEPGRTVKFNNGKNTYITEDGLQLRASTNGCVKIKTEKVFVEDLYRVNNVDNETGNIDFIGNVVINGDVKTGFKVKAKGDIKIRGIVEGAFIESGGDVSINKGMNGRGKGTIYAKGDITSKYIENAKIKSEKSIYAEALINSDVTAKQSVILRGQNSAILGGTTRAGKMIYAKKIGSEINAETNLIIDLSNYEEERAAFEKRKKEKFFLERDLNNKNKELKEIEEKIDLVSNVNFQNENKNILRKHLIFKRLKINNEINEKKQQLDKNVPIEDISNNKIICKGIMYTNTRISVGWIKYRVKQDISYSKIYNDGNDINIVTLNPSDLD